MVRQLLGLVFDGKKVLVRADLDVPVKSTNDERLTTNAQSELATRLTNLAPTVNWLIEHGAKQVIIFGHIGRPSDTGHETRDTQEDKPPLYDPKLSTRQLEAPLERILKRSVTYKKDFNLDDGMIVSMAQLILLENLRFWPGEAANDGEFARQLAALADVYVNEAFGNCHRNHASMVTVPAILPHTAGLHLEEEVNQLTKLTRNPERPLVWNGPMGVFEEGFEAGTMAIAEAIIDSKAYSVVGGGETTQFLSTKGLLGKFSFVSSGGGAMLAFLAGKELPGIEALE